MKRLLFFIFAALLLSGCQGTPRYGGGLHNREADYKSEEKKEEVSVPVPGTGVDPLVMGEIIDRFLGRPYSDSTQTQTAMDCSEFVGAVYYEYASIHLPRTVENLFQTGSVVAAGDLRFGDLVFFDTGGQGASHVGIYVGFDEFVHSSTSSGIVISNLNDKYYGKRFLGARRVMG
jgi:cell wall-associated NlpC family hydrolase